MKFANPQQVVVVVVVVISFNQVTRAGDIRDLLELGADCLSVYRKLIRRILVDQRTAGNAQK